MHLKYTTTVQNFPHSVASSNFSPQDKKEATETLVMSRKLTQVYLSDSSTTRKLYRNVYYAITRGINAWSL
jgi:hypothetical protein